MIYKYMKYTRRSLFKDLRVSPFKIIILGLICFRCLEVCRPNSALFAVGCNSWWRSLCGNASGDCKFSLCEKMGLQGATPFWWEDLGLNSESKNLNTQTLKCRCLVLILSCLLIKKKNHWTKNIIGRISRKYSCLRFLLPHKRPCSAPCLAPFSCRQPPHCVPDTYSNATLWYKIFTTARDANTKYAQDYNPFWCYKGAIGKVYHALNPKLTVIVPDVSERKPVCLCVSSSC